MLTKAVKIFAVAAIVLAVWKVSGGNLGAFVIGTWDNVVYPVLDMTSTWLITLWNAIFS